MTRPAATSTRGGKRASRYPATGPATTSPAISGAMASIPNTGPKRGTIAKYCGRMSIGADLGERDHDAGEQGDGHGPPVDLQVRRVGDPPPALPTTRYATSSATPKPMIAQRTGLLPARCPATGRPTEIATTALAHSAVPRT